jgi:hypothetical protein
MQAVALVRQGGDCLEIVVGELIFAQGLIGSRGVIGRCHAAT